MGRPVEERGQNGVSVGMDIVGREREHRADYDFLVEWAFSTTIAAANGALYFIWCVFAVLEYSSLTLSLSCRRQTIIYYLRMN